MAAAGAGTLNQPLIESEDVEQGNALNRELSSLGLAKPRQVRLVYPEIVRHGLLRYEGRGRERFAAAACDALMGGSRVRREDEGWRQINLAQCVG